MSLQFIKPVICVTLVATLLSVAACRPLSELAPTTDMIATQQQNIDVVQLNRGRTIYLQDCARCHSVLPIHDFTKEEWHDELPEMIMESNLTKEEETDLRAYIAAALQYTPPPPAK